MLERAGKFKGASQRLRLMQKRFGLWPASGKVERKRRAAFSGTKPEHSAATEPQTEATAAVGNQKNSNRDECKLFAAEREWSRGE